MTRHILSREDQNFLLYEWLHVEDLTRHDRYKDHDKETFDAVLALAEAIATEHYAPHNRLGDVSEPTFDGHRVETPEQTRRTLDVLARSGLIAASMSESVGGSQLPHSVATACFAWFQAANVATWAYTSLSIANANLIARYGTPDQIGSYVVPIIEGRFHGTMCLSEPQAGSSLGGITTRAELQPDGSYRLYGNKTWISGGDHELGDNIVHLVLARTADAPAGVKGLSLFVVPKILVAADGHLGERNDVATAGLNHKMGFRGTTNAVLNFGEGLHKTGGQPGAVGLLLGERGSGLAHMFHMMNEARIAVGAQAAALGVTGYLKSLDYSRIRCQGRPAGRKRMTDGPVPLVEHADVRRMLLTQKCYVEGAMALVLLCGHLLDERLTAPDPEAADDAHLLLELLTPVAKSWPSEWCVRANDIAIQVLGGYGYTRDYDVEQHYRDNRLNPIHEGTTGIQALDLLGRKVRLANGRALELLDTRIRATVERAKGAGNEAQAFAATLENLWRGLRMVTRTINESDDPDRLANASIYLDAFGHTVVGWIWLDILLTCGSIDDALHNGKRQAAQFFHRYELPRIASQLELLTRLDRTTVEMAADWF